MAQTNMDGTRRERTWQWFLDVPRRLNVAVELLGADGDPLLPAAPTPAGRSMRELVTDQESVRALIAEAWRSGQLQRAAVDSLQIVCISVEPAGVLVVGRQADGAEADRRPGLDQIAAWMAAAVQDVVSRDHDELSPEPYRIGSLERLLGEAAARGSARSVLGAFVEAFAVWDDIRVFAYSVTVTGRPIAFVSPVGVRTTPPRLDRATFGAGEIVRLSREEAEGLQLADGCDVLVQQVTGGDRVHWVLVFTGTISEPQEVRIALYAAILKETLNATLAKSALRMGELINRRAAPGLEEALEPAAEALSRELMQLVEADSGALAVRIKRGRQTLAVGRTELLPPWDAESPGNRLTVTTFDDDSLMAFVALREHPEFTTVELTIAEIAAGEVHRWLRAAMDQSPRFERRERGRATEAIFEELAIDAVGAGQQVALVVLLLGTSVLRPGMMQSCVAKVRDSIRPSDFAAALNEREIVVLLCETSTAGARGAAARLAGQLECGPDGTSFNAAVGLAIAQPGGEMPASLIRAARANVLAVA